jgi:hypothetical protein
MRLPVPLIVYNFSILQIAKSFATDYLEKHKLKHSTALAVFFTPVRPGQLLPPALFEPNKAKTMAFFIKKSKKPYLFLIKKDRITSRFLKTLSLKNSSRETVNPRRPPIIQTADQILQAAQKLESAKYKYTYFFH